MKKIVLTLLTAIMTGALILSACGSVPAKKETKPETREETLENVTAPLPVPERPDEPAPAMTAESPAETPPVSSSPAEDPESAAYDDDPSDSADVSSSRPAAALQPKDEDAAAADFVVVSQVIPDAILEIRYHSTYNFVGDRIDGYDEPCALLTREAAEALKAASDDLMAQGYRIKIYDAYRPQDAVSHFMRWAKDLNDTRMKDYFYPEVDKADLFTSGYIGKRSGHSRGCTVDLTLFDMRTNRDVDMGGTFDYFGERSHPDFGGISKEQHENRMILRKAMTAHGFKPLSTEWWHFTLVNEPYPDTYFNFPVRSEAVEPSGT